MLLEIESTIAITLGLIALVYPIKKLWSKMPHHKNRILLEDIRQELKPNGGASLRDALNRIEERQCNMESFILTQLNVYDTAIFRTDAKGKITYTNRKYQKLTEFSFPESQGDGWINSVVPQEREKVLNKWMEAIESGREFHEKITLEKASGERHEVMVSTFKELNRTGKVAGYLGVLNVMQPTAFG